MQYNYIVIEGNIGSGKTSLAKMIAEEYNAKFIPERFEDNSFLPKFYKDPDKYAFPLEMSFLADRYQQLKDELSKRDLFKSFIVADYFIDKSLIFARNNLQKDEFNLYARLFEIMNSTLPKPELILYLHNNVLRLKENINHRGRSYENSIQTDYLEKIQEGYFNYFRHKTERRIVIVDTQHIDFVANKDDYQKVRELIDKTYPPGIHRITFF